MGTRIERSRLTRDLLRFACERFYACEVCREAEAYESIEDALRPLRLKPRELKRLLQGLTCPGCESRISSGTFVVTRTAEELRQARLARNFDAVYGAQVKDFREFLIGYPMLGAEHPIGSVLAKAMKRAQATTLQPSTWYRATRYTAGARFGPRAPCESTRANRYNQIGQVAWYLGSDEKTAAVEVTREPRVGELICMAEVRLTEAIGVLDLRSIIWGTDPLRQWVLRNVVAGRFISEPTSDVEDSRPEYRIPQFIADLSRRRKFRGILYDSTRPSAYNNPEAVGHNLVVFDPIPVHTVAVERVVRFDEPDEDPFSPERWPLRTVSVET